jgi:hypothetical protein
MWLVLYYPKARRTKERDIKGEKEQRLPRLDSTGPGLGTVR